MAWTAKVVDFDNQGREVHLEFKEDATGEVYADRFPVPMGASASWLPDLVRDKIAALSARATIAAPIAAGLVTPSAAVSVPAGNAARDQWHADFLKLKRMNVLVTQGVLTSLDIVTQLATVKAGYQASYIDYVNNQT